MSSQIATTWHREDSRTVIDLAERNLSGDIAPAEQRRAAIQSAAARDRLEGGIEPRLVEEGLQVKRQEARAVVRPAQICIPSVGEPVIGTLKIGIVSRIAALQNPVQVHRDVVTHLHL